MLEALLNWTVKIKDGDVFISCDGYISCYLCGAEMIPDHANKLKFSSDPNGGEQDCRAVDIYAQCPNCHVEELFGVALSDDEHNAMDLMSLEFKNEQPSQ